MNGLELVQARRRVAVARHDIGIESKWLHLKRGTTYWVQAVGMRESDGEPLVVYREMKNGTCWVRPVDEFLDGRFVRMHDTPLAAGSSEPKGATSEGAG